MHYINAECMKELDRLAQEQFGIPGIVLMENAGLRAAAYARTMLKRLKSNRVCVVCGPGNNGGDGYVVARQLVNSGVDVRVVRLIPEKYISGDALNNYCILKKMRVPRCAVSRRVSRTTAADLFTTADLVIDAIFGIGLNKEITGHFKTVIEAINASGLPVLSLDIPSGLCASSGKIFGVCVRAKTTVTFAVPKKGFIQSDGPRVTGKVVVADISLPRSLLSRQVLRKACR